MKLKKRIGKLEKTVGIEGNLEDARAAVEFALEYEILPRTIDVEKAVQAFASEGISIGKTIEEIHRRSNGLPKLPCEIIED